MPANRRPVWILAAQLASVATPGLACTLPPPASAEVLAERVRNYQGELWERSDAVFLSEASAFERIAIPGGDGFSATLVPSLALKGDLPAERIGIRHTTLSGREGEWFVTFARRLPTGLSVDATVPVGDLIEPEALRAWRKGYEPEAPET